MHRFAIAALALSTLAVFTLGASAADNQIGDVRLIGGVGHGDVEGEFGLRTTGSGNLRSGLTGDDDERKRIAVQAAWSMNAVGAKGLLIGAEFGWDSAQVDLHPDTFTSDFVLESESIGGLVFAGVACSPSERFHVELAPFVGMAMVDYDLKARTAAGVVTSDDSGTSLTYGVRGGAYVMASSRIQLGLEARWFRERSSATFDRFGGTATNHLDMDIEEDGVLFLASIGYRL